jgi:hypothetical protein
VVDYILGFAKVLEPGQGAQLRGFAAQGGQRRFGERDAKLERVVDKWLKVGASRLSGQRILEHGRNRHAPQRRVGASAIFAIDFFSNGDGFADVHGVLLFATLQFKSAPSRLCFQPRHACPGQVPQNVWRTTWSGRGGSA